MQCNVIYNILYIIGNIGRSLKAKKVVEPLHYLFSGKSIVILLGFHQPSPLNASCKAG